jgi:hypothetical protein
MRVAFEPRNRCYETSPPLQNSCDLPIFKASEVTLHVLRQKTGDCGSFRPDGTTRRCSCPARVLELRSDAGRRGAVSASLPEQKVTCNAPPGPPPTKTGPCECRAPAGWRRC